MTKQEEYESLRDRSEQAADYAERARNNGGWYQGQSVAHWLNAAGTMWEMCLEAERELPC